MQHPAESGRYVKLYNAMLYLHCELNCLFFAREQQIDYSIYYCFYIRQYVKDHFLNLMRISKRRTVQGSTPMKVNN